MPKMGVAAIAMHFRAAHEPGIICLLSDHFGIFGLVKGWPAGTAVELVFLVKKLCTATNTGKCPGAGRKILVRKGSFGSVFSRDLIR